MPGKAYDEDNLTHYEDPYGTNLSFHCPTAHVGETEEVADGS